jgi:hypothetical protein
MQLVNAFSSQTDVEMKAKVITRFQNISQLLKILEKILAGNIICQALFRWSAALV